MHAPQIGPLLIDDPDTEVDEWSGHAAVLVHRPASVAQALLDHQPRVARLIADATRILHAAIIQTYTASDFRWEKLDATDMTDGWAPS